MTNKKFPNVIGVISFTGLWLYVILLMVAFEVLGDIGVYTDVPEYVYLLVSVALAILPITITWTNIQRKKYGCEDFGPFACFKRPEKEIFTKQWNKAAYPKIPEKYLSEEPNDLIIGKLGKRYIRIPIIRDGLNMFIIGNVGSSKTVALISWLLTNLYLPSNGLRWNWAIFDVKGEIYQKILRLPTGHYRAVDHKKVKVIEPSNQDSYGYDPFYIMKNPDVTETDIIKLSDDIAAMIIEDSGGDSNPFFSLNAKKIMSGLVYHYVKKGYEFIPLMQLIARSNLSELIETVVAEAEEDIEGVTLDKLKGFVGRDTESLNDVFATMLTRLQIFSYPEIIWTLFLNPHKTSPADLDDGETCIDVAISQSMLSSYEILMRIIAMGILFHAERHFTDQDERNTVIIIDEAARIGRLASKGSFSVDAAEATLRSRHCGIIQIFQSMHQFVDLYGPEVSKVILSLCEAKVILSGDGDKESTEFAAAMAPEYRAAKSSYDKKGIAGSPSNCNYSDEYRNVINSEAMMNLRERYEFIGFLYGTYIRGRKNAYYTDPILGPIYQEIRNYNQAQKKEQEEKQKLISQKSKETGGNEL